MDWIKYFIINANESGIKVNDLKQGISEESKTENSFDLCIYTNGKKKESYKHKKKVKKMLYASIDKNIQKTIITHELLKTTIYGENCIYCTYVHLEDGIGKIFINLGNRESDAYRSYVLFNPRNSYNHNHMETDTVSYYRNYDIIENTGIHIHYRPGNKLLKLEYLKGMSNSTIITRDKNNILIIKNMEDHKMQGPLYKWNANGKIESICNYDRGFLKGIQYKWHNNGTLKSIHNYVDNQIKRRY